MDNKTKEIIKHLQRMNEDLEEFKSMSDLTARNLKNDFIQQTNKIFIEFLTK